MFSNFETKCNDKYPENYEETRDITKTIDLRFKHLELKYTNIGDFR